ncbi:hypothetical protein HZH68_005549 [Vespula germanica]|uniref:Uncharacterized protein n=1 Tax=Vespula germanica TaxID=30212 RepID=A0A834KGF2_VESGE|nr:hypothetical protein HZH68_005549 [Vespula germanica]
MKYLMILNMNNVTPLVRSHGKAVTASTISPYRILHTQDGNTMATSNKLRTSKRKSLKRYNINTFPIESRSSDTEVNWSKQVGIGTGEKSVSDDLLFCKGYGVTKCEFN